MASRTMCRQLGVVLYCGNYSLARSVRLQHKDLGRRLICARKWYCTAVSDNLQDVDVRYVGGLPVIALPLPSRQEKCQFTLRPISNTLGDLFSFIQQEDRGVDRLAAYNLDGLRLASSTPIDLLLRNDFELEVNQRRYTVQVPESALHSTEHVESLRIIQNQIAQLYSTMNIEQYQTDREKNLLERLEYLNNELKPLEELKLELETKAQTKTTSMQWMGLGLMGLQFGILARLTWFEYSWDIMEPVTYFVTYGTSIAMYAYYCTTKQEYTFPEVRDREFLLALHKHAKKRNLDMKHYNKIRDELSQTELDLERLRDPLQMQLPLQQLLKKSKDPAAQ